jgi:long-chain acyl-CoA synthetase
MSSVLDLYRQTIEIPARASDPADEPLHLSVIDYGPRDALRTLVFVHGFGGRMEHWMPQLEFFGEDNRVVALDWRGHGFSDAPHTRYDVPELVEDLRLMLEKLNVPQKFILLCHSFGGALAAYFANLYPERVEKLVIIASAVKFRLRRVGRITLGLPTPILKAAQMVVPRAKLYPPAHVVTSLNKNALSIWDGTNYLRKISVPTLVILGHRDILFQRDAYEEVANLIPGAEKVVIPVSKHQVMVERPDAVNRAIERFLGTVSDADERERKRKARRELERQRPWLKFYDSRTPYRIEPPVAPLQRSLEIAAGLYPKRPALIFYDKPMTYRTLDRTANRFANGLLRLGLKPGERVLILLPNTPQALIAYYGTLKAGGVVVFSNPLFNRDELAAQIKDCGAKIVITLSLFYEAVKVVAQEAGVQHVVVTSFKEYMQPHDKLLFRILREKQEGHEMPREAPAPGVGLHTFASLLWFSSPKSPEQNQTVHDLAVIQYTSGTTGSPSGIMLTDYNLASNALQIRHWIAEARAGDETILAVLPFSHSYGLTGCLNIAPLLGATLLLMPNFVTQEVLEAIAKYRPTIFPGVPQMYMKIANFPDVKKYGISSVRVCVSGGAPLALEVQEAFERLTRGRLVEGYGLTEASPVTHANPLSGRRRAGSMGLPLPDTEVRIVDLKTGEILPEGQVGELLVRGPQIMRGYWNKREETDRAIEADGWLHTGDLARMDEDGYFYIIDRKKDLILAGEFNVYPRDIEEVLFEHPKVLDVAVVGVPPNSPEHKVKAYVVLRPGERATAEELREFCRRRLANYAIPSSVEFLPELPRNFIGKVLRRILSERDISPNLPSAPEPELTQTLEEPVRREG